VVKIKRGFEIIKKNGLAYLAIPAFEDTGMVKHCFTSRIGGVSQGIYNSLNTSDDKEDPIENVHRNLELVCEAIGVNYRNLVFSDQTHEDNSRLRTQHPQDICRSCITAAVLSDIYLSENLGYYV
jgi:copper oxidase (laccase) domain-containing protein